METLKIDWVKTNYNNLYKNYDSHYYAFSRGRTLLYIGISCYQDIIIEIDKTLNRLNIKISGLTIWLGFVNIQKSSYTRITKQIILDGERLMIITNQPNYNQQCKEKYYGRCNFKVRTSGCKYIRQCIRCENNRIYLSC